MARIRSIKPEFWKHQQLGKMSMDARLTYIGMWNLADDAGRGRAADDLLWGELHSGQPPSARRRWSRVLKELSRVQDDRGHLVIFYKVAGAAYYWIPGFCRQQRIDKPYPSRLPPPPNSKNVPRTFQERSTLEQGVEWSGEEHGEEGKGGASAIAPAPDVPPMVATDVPTNASTEPNFITQAQALVSSLGTRIDAKPIGSPGCQTAHDESIRQLLQTAKQTTKMPNLEGTIRATLESTTARYGTERVHQWLMDGSHVGFDVREMLDSLRKSFAGKGNGKPKSRCHKCDGTKIDPIARVVHHDHKGEYDAPAPCGACNGTGLPS